MKADKFAKRDYMRMEDQHWKGEQRAWAKVSPAVEFTKKLADGLAWIPRKEDKT